MVTTTWCRFAFSTELWLDLGDRDPASPPRESNLGCGEVGEGAGKIRAS